MRNGWMSALVGLDADAQCLGLYTDESAGLKVDPVVVLVLSLVFIFSVVALHSKSCLPRMLHYRMSADSVPVLAKITRRFSS